MLLVFFSVRVRKMSQIYFTWQFYSSILLEITFLHSQRNSITKPAYLIDAGIYAKHLGQVRNWFGLLLIDRHRKLAQTLRRLRTVYRVTRIGDDCGFLVLRARVPHSDHSTSPGTHHCKIGTHLECISCVTDPWWMYSLDRRLQTC